MHHRRRFILAVLTYCHAPAHSCSRLIPCEDRALTIRGFPRPAPCREGCKVFLENGPTQGPSGPTPSSPRVALGSAPLPRHRSTFSASSEDLARPRWEGAVTTASTAPANCPPETGWTRSEATEGVDDTNGLAEVDERRRINCENYPPPPPSGTTPVSGIE